MKLFHFFLSLLILVLAGCSASPASTPLPAASATPSPSPTFDPNAPCSPQPVIAPTLPAVIPGYTELDETTNLHITGTYQVIDPATYRLVVSGKVDNPLNLTYDELRCLPKKEVSDVLICPGYFEDYARWAGVPLAFVLDLAQVQPDAKALTLKGADGFNSYLELEKARLPDNLLAYEWEGQPLPVLHGFPLRGVFPGQVGSHWVKWLLEIVVE